MTQTELEAGADAVRSVAEKYGYASYLNRDVLREIAAAVINSYTPKLAVGKAEALLDNLLTLLEEHTDDAGQELHPELRKKCVNAIRAAFGRQSG